MTIPLRLILVTPWHVASAIGRLSFALAQELSATGVYITIVRSEDSRRRYPRAISQEFPVLSPSEFQKLHRGRDFDSVVYALGDSPYHQEAFELMRFHPGIVILHDTVFSAREWTVGDAASISTGAIVHSRHYFSEVARACPGPVFYQPLPWSPGIQPLNSHPLGFGRKLTLGIIGRLNSNKLPDRVIEAVGDNLLTEKFRVKLVGSVDPRFESYLKRLALDRGVELIVAGEVSDAEFKRHIQVIDVFMVLREPAIEGASASAIEAISTGKPTVVCDVASYSEIPDDIVTFIKPNPSPRDIGHLLAEISKEYLEFVPRPESVRKWLAETRSPSKYARGLLDLIPGSFRAASIADSARNLCSKTFGFDLPVTANFWEKMQKIDEAVLGLGTEREAPDGDIYSPI